MKENILKFITEEKALLWIKTSNFQEVERVMIESLNSLENKKFYIYEKGKTINFLNGGIESGMDNLFNTLDELYPQGIKRVPIFLLVKDGIDEILRKENLDYFKEIVETKKETPRYNITVIIANKENVPPELEDMVEFIDKEIIDNEVAIKNYILDLAEFEKLEINEVKLDKIVKLLKKDIHKFSKNDNTLDENMANMIFVEGGEYKPPFADEKKEVLDLEVCKYPTTQKMWQEVMEYNPSQFKGDNKPVDSVTWWQALEFCNKLSEKYRLQPTYDLSNSSNGILMINQLNGKAVYPDEANFGKTEGFRLPTEVEWEWFARGGQEGLDDGSFYFLYAGSDDLAEVGWYVHNSGAINRNGSSKEVGLKKPNKLGIYDCSGNVFEWCYDTVEFIKNAFYARVECENRLGNGKDYLYKHGNLDLERRLKGGGWGQYGAYCFVRTRHHAYPDHCYSDLGFRIVRTVHL
ncbi:formylglycine-generating enzyme family protein [Fusobacterium pseudoperiodonticum]